MLNMFKIFAIIKRCANTDTRFLILKNNLFVVFYYKKNWGTKFVVTNCKPSKKLQTDFSLLVVVVLSKYQTSREER